MSQFRHTRSAFAIALTAAAAFMAVQGSVSARTYKVIHKFCKKLECGDGANPGESLAADQFGNLYGTAGGGSHDAGIVFRLSPPSDGNEWKYKVLYNFCDRASCTDGSSPDQSSLVIDTAGNIYGTTTQGGSAGNDGVVFRLAPNAQQTRWKLTILHNFCFQKSKCPDGQTPYGGLTYAGAQSGVPYDGVSALYGATSGGGTHFGGVAYSLAPAANGKWTENVLYAFCGAGGTNCTDGYSPFGQLVIDSAGNLYGVGLGGGSANSGVVFKLSPQLGEKRWAESVLHFFCSLPNCADGSDSLSGLVLDATGNLFGAASNHGGNGGGVVFKVTPEGDYSVVYDFCAQENCGDGLQPFDQGGLVMDPSGNLYGTTAGGGRNVGGTVFALSGNALNVLHDFCYTDSCAKGAHPRGGLLRDLSGDLFGTTQVGGKHAGGVVFELTP